MSVSVNVSVNVSVRVGWGRGEVRLSVLSPARDSNVCPSAAKARQDTSMPPVPPACAFRNTYK